jgi:hypothetical protein
METGIFKDVKDLEAFALSDDFNRIWRKQLIYAGSFVKNVGKKDEQRFTITEEQLKHWNETGEKMLSAGVEIPLPIEHTTNPEARRGEIRGYEIALDKKGRKSLYGLVKFRDAEAEKLALTANVSIYAPLESSDGNGNKYSFPIQHVALTDYPVIPGLEKFEAIAASMIVPETVNPKPENKKMNFAELAKAIGVEYPEGSDDMAIAKAIVDAVAAMKNKPAETPKPEAPKPAPIAAGFLNMAKDNRNGKLEKLIIAGKITPAVSKKLQEQFCTPEALSLSLSATGEATDSFDAVLSALEENNPVDLKEKTRPQGVIALSQNDLKDASKNPLLKNAEERAAKK